MPKNMGTVDRIVRIVAAIVLAALFLNGTLSGVLGIVALVVAVVFLATSLLGSCPLYVPLGMSTCKGGKAAKG